MSDGVFVGLIGPTADSGQFSVVEDLKSFSFHKCSEERKVGAQRAYCNGPMEKGTVLGTYMFIVQEFLTIENSKVSFLSYRLC